MADDVDYPIGPLNDWRIYRGDGPKAYPVTDKNNDESEFDMTILGSTWTCQARTAEDASTAINIAVDDTDAATGTLVLTLSAAQTAAMLSDHYLFDVQVVDGAGRILTAYGPGRIIVTKDVTR